MNSGKLASLFMVAILFLAVACPDGRDGRGLHASDKNETPLLSFSVISDTHCDAEIDSNNNTSLSIALRDLKRANPKAAALIVTGDITQHARDGEYDSFRQVLDSVPHPPLYPVMGNHDVRGLRGGYREAIGRYLAKTKMPGAYYDKWIGGHHFIFLATEKDLKDQAHLSDEQLAWLEARIAEKGAADRPVFVFLHQSLPGTSAGSLPADRYDKSGYPDGVVQDGALRSILARHPRSVFITGHTHAAVDDPNSVTCAAGAALCVNASSAAYTASSAGYGKARESEGLVVDVYPGRVVFRGRNFGRHLWVREWTADYSSSGRLTVTADKSVYDAYLASIRKKAYAGDEVDILKEVIDDNPKNKTALKKIVLSYLDMKDFAGAHDYAKKYLAVDPADDNYFHYGKTFYDRGRYDLSVHYFSEGYASGGNRAYLKWLADACQKSGDTGKAEKYREQMKRYAEVPKAKWAIASVDSEETGAKNNGARNSIDGNSRTLWHTEWKGQAPPCPHEIIIDLGDLQSISGFSYLPRQDGNYNGDIDEFELYASVDGGWKSPCVARGKFPKSKIEKIVILDQKVRCRYIKLRALSEVNGRNRYTSAAEINFYTDR